MNYEANEVFAALEAWINRRPGLNPEDYGIDRPEGRRAYRQEAASITRDRTRALEALREARTLQPPNAAALEQAFRAYSGRPARRENESPGQYILRAFAAHVEHAAANARYRKHDGQASMLEEQEGLFQ